MSTLCDTYRIETSKIRTPTTIKSIQGKTGTRDQLLMLLEKYGLHTLVTGDFHTPVVFYLHETDEKPLGRVQQA